MRGKLPRNAAAIAVDCFCDTVRAMRSLRNRLRRAVLAVPLASCACLGSPAQVASPTASSATSATSGTTSSSGSTGIGHTLCDGCAAQGLVCNVWETGCTAPNSAIGAAGTSGGGTNGGGSTTGGSTGDSCPTLPPCPTGCDCVGLTLTVPPIRDQVGAPNICQCFDACPAFPDGGTDITTEPSHLAGCSTNPSDAGADDGGLLIDLNCYYATSCSGGRRPEGLAPLDDAAPQSMGAWFARQAHLEAASVLAFRRLARELRALGAPEHLVTRASQAAREEVRHARMMRTFADRHGAPPIAVHVEPEQTRTLLDLALENMREGCVGETFGAALADWQAMHAAHPDLRSASEAIHDDEAGHAELAWELDAWIQPRLSESERERVRIERERAIEALESDASPMQRALVTSLRSELWETLSPDPFPMFPGEGESC